MHFWLAKYEGNGNWRKIQESLDVIKFTEKMWLKSLESKAYDMTYMCVLMIEFSNLEIQSY